MQRAVGAARGLMGNVFVYFIPSHWSEGSGLSGQWPWSILTEHCTHPIRISPAFSKRPMCFLWHFVFHFFFKIWLEAKKNLIRAQQCTEQKSLSLLSHPVAVSLLWQEMFVCLGVEGWGKIRFSLLPLGEVQALFLSIHLYQSVALWKLKVRPSKLCDSHSLLERNQKEGEI